MATSETFADTAERIYHTTDTRSGVCDGHDELRPVLEQVAERKPPLRTYHRDG